MPLLFPTISSVPWISDTELESDFPHYKATTKKIETLLDEAQVNGLTDQEAAAMMATFHARAVARLRPSAEHLEFVADVFCLCVRDLMADH